VQHEITFNYAVFALRK